MMRANLLVLSFDFNYSCGVSKHVYNNLKLFSNTDDFELHFITNSGDSLDRLNKLTSLKISFFSFRKDHNNIYYLVRDALNLYLYCKKNKIDIIHSHHRYAELLSVIVSKICKLKTITTAHSFVEGQKKISFRSDKVICVSNSVKQHLVKNYPHVKNRVEVIYNCVDKDFMESTKLYTEQHQFFIDKNYKTILFVGRNKQIKGLDILLKSMQKLSVRYKLKLIVVGFEKNEVLKNQTNYPYNTEFQGVQRNMIQYYKECDIVVIPSRKDPFPYVMLEAATMKKPIIGSNTGGISEFISDGLDGTLFKVEDENDLSDKIEFLINNYDKAIDMANKLFEKVIKEYSCESYFNNLVRIYKEL